MAVHDDQPLPQAIGDAERKAGTLRSGSGKKVTSKKQAIAVGLSEARKEGSKALSKLDPSDATRRAADLARDAYEHDSATAAEIYAFELPRLAVGEVSDYQAEASASWVLAFELGGATEAQISAGLAAAHAVLDVAGVSPWTRSLRSASSKAGTSPGADIRRAVRRGRSRAPCPRCRPGPRPSRPACGVLAEQGPI